MGATHQIRQGNSRGIHPPSRHTKKQRVVIVCDGMPSIPYKSSLLHFLSKQGFWAIHLRYRGTWESGGSFLRKSPERDIIDLIDGLPKGFTSMWDRKRYRVRPDAVFIIASSFGGPAGILASRDKRVKKVVAISPVVDWRASSKGESLDWLERFVRDGFGEGYRFSHKDWKKLGEGISTVPSATPTRSTVQSCLSSMPAMIKPSVTMRS